VGDHAVDEARAHPATPAKLADLADEALELLAESPPRGLEAMVFEELLGLLHVRARPGGPSTTGAFRSETPATGWLFIAAAAAAAHSDWSGEAVDVVMQRFRRASDRAACVWDRAGSARAVLHAHRTRARPRGGQGGCAHAPRSRAPTDRFGGSRHGWSPTVSISGWRSVAAVSSAPGSPSFCRLSEAARSPSGSARGSER
jgi:hypothetical protein